MSLKGRIAFTIFVIIIVPIVLTAVVFYFFTNYKVHQIGERYGIENPTYASVYSNTMLISRQIQEKYIRIREILSADPEKLEDTVFLAELNEEMSDTEAFIVVRRGDEMFFNGSDSIPDDEILAALPPYREPEVEEVNYNIQTSDRVMFRQIDVLFRDGTPASIFLVSPTDRIMPEIRAWAAQLVFVMIVILVAISVIMGIWLYRGIVRPLGELKTAAQNVRDGNLNFTVEKNGVQEIGELCQDFEEMRIRLKESAEEKVEFDRENRELISNISHDLKTPLTTIRGYVEGVIDGVANTPEKLERYMRTVNSKVNEMTLLLDELTVYSKIDTNKVPYTFAKVDPEAFFGDCTADMRIDLEEHNIDLEFHSYLKERSEIIADAEQLRRVVNNIIGNSVKYMDKEHGRIAIRLRDVGDSVQVEIEDNGRGVARNELPRIFDRFYRADASRNSRQGGSGIGLSIVKKIIEDHAGRVWAASKEGEGTTIYFTFRKYVESVAGPAEEQAPAKGKKKSRRQEEKAQKSGKNRNLPTVRKRSRKRSGGKKK